MLKWIPQGHHPPPRSAGKELHRDHITIATLRDGRRPRTSEPEHKGAFTQGNFLN